MQRPCSNTREEAKPSNHESHFCQPALREPTLANHIALTLCVATGTGQGKHVCAKTCNASDMLAKTRSGENKEQGTGCAHEEIMGDPWIMQVFVPGGANKKSPRRAPALLLLPRTGFHALPDVHTDVSKLTLPRRMV